MIHVFGTICLDWIRQVPEWPARGGYLELPAEYQVRLGGEAANTANALHRWGAAVTLSGNNAGSDHMGQTLRNLLAENGLMAVTCRPTAEQRTPICEIYVTPDGERTMLGRGFSDMAGSVDPSQIPLSAGEWFTAEPNMGDVAREVARRAADAGMKVYLMDFIREDDPIPAGSYWQGSTDWAGKRGDVAGNLAWVADWAQRHGCFSILSDGPRGFVAGSPGEPARQYPAYPAPVIVDTTGAGDLFRAGMLFGLENGWPIPICLQLASAAGCLECGLLGATGPVPSISEIEALIAKHPGVSEQYL